MGKLKKLIIALGIGLVFTFIFGGQSEADTLQEDIASKIIRFHVLANSDSEEDQALKLKVKETVVNYISEYLNKELTLEESKQIINEKMDDILNVASGVISEEGYDYNVSAEVTTCYFPIKQYGDVTLPAGNYEAFRIEIGGAEGKNWWCILYPPLCFVDVTYGIVPDDSKQLLKNILDEDEYDAITGNGENTEYRFKIFSFLNNIFD